MSSNPEELDKKDILTENHDADSNSSDATFNGNKNKLNKKKTLSDMLKKLHPDQVNGLESAEIPTFLKKDSPQPTDPDHSLISNNDDRNESKTATSSPTSPATQTKVSSPKLNADVYKCAIKNCTKSFGHVNDFKQHINSQHSNVDSLPCCFCFSSFMSENYFDHLSCHIKNLMKCLYCQVSHDTREELLKHLSEKHPNQPKKINVCIRILNNLRGKKSHSDGNQESKIRSKSPFKMLLDSSKKSDSIAASTVEAPKSRNRKASKPVKSLNQLANSDEVEIEFVKDELPIKCGMCSFSCNTDIHLKQHLHDGHENPSNFTLFQCKQCKMNADDKDVFETHLAHHTGKQVIRYYTCPYCSTISNNMETIENHIADSHVDKAFRFEVMQEKIEYLQDLVICPVCNGAYRWKNNFILHLESVHSLKDLAQHFLSTYPDKELPSQLKAFRSYFKNLLPDAPDYDNEASNKIVLPSADYDSSSEKKDEFAEDETDWKEKKECNKSMEHPLLYHMLSKKPTDAGTNPSPIIIQPSSSPPPSSESMQYSERYPPADLAQFVVKKGTPTTFSCNLCPFECTKTTHFRRHMDIHKRNESLSDGYKCGYCQFAHPRLNCIRFHLGKYHAELPYMMTRIVDNSYINMGPEDDPTLKKSKAKVPFVTSTPIISQRPERERRVPVKMETDFNWSPSKSPSKSPGASTSCINCDHMSLSEFEKYLPSIMIFPDVYKCPKCNFTNRVRVNLLNHLKLHKAQEEKVDSVEENNKIGDMDENSADDGEDGDEDKVDGNSKLSNLNPLFNFLSDKKCDADFLDDAEEVTFVTRANLTDEYKNFSVKIPNSNHYQCKECNFIHRYPSKVKRHYYYKHAPAFPYKCGYCSFGAVEGGKVKRHCKVVHPNKREMVVKRNVYKKNAAGDGHNSSINKINNTNSSKIFPHQKVIEDDDCETEQDSVKLKKQFVYKCDDDNNDLWLPQFVTLLDDDIQCCKLCGYQQDGSSSLREHVLTAHLEFYPYSCAHCGFALMDLSRVRKHIDVHHPGLSYSAFHRCIVDNENNDGQNNNHSIKAGDENDDENYSDENDSQNSQMVIDESSQLESIEFNDDDIDGNIGRSSAEEEEIQKVSTPAPRIVNNKQVISDVFNGKRQFKCYYCGVISKWNRRDIRLHVLHVHLRKKVYTCRHCGFGNSKSKAIVKTHCMKFHPTKNVSVKDELALFNAIIPIEDANGIVTMVLSNKNGDPILELPEDGITTNRNDSKSSKPVTTNSSKTLKEETTSKPSPVKTFGGNNSKLHECQFKCKLCSYASSTEIDVKYHILSSHLNIRPYSCPHCRAYLSRPELVLTHIEKYHPDKKKEVRDTLEERALYLQKNIEYIGLKRAPTFHFPNLNEEEDVIDESFAKIMERQKNPRYSSGYFRCLLCGYRDPRNDKTKYHIIKSHLNLRQFSCPHCNQYMWGRQQVLTHIEEEHPGKEVYVKRTFHEYDEFLRKNIRKFSFPKSNNAANNNNIQDDGGLRDAIKTRAIPRIQCDSCSFVTDSELSLAAHKRTHKIFQCFYCDYKHMLAARVQSHCLEKHPSNLVRFKHVDSSNFESTKVTGAGVDGENDDDGNVTDVEDEDRNEESGYQHDNMSAEEEFENVHDNDGDDNNDNNNNNNDDDDDEEEEEEMEDGMMKDQNDRIRIPFSLNTFVCQICQSVRWSKSDILIHSNEMHPDRVPSFITVKTESGESLKKIGGVKNKDGSGRNESHHDDINDGDDEYGTNDDIHHFDDNDDDDDGGDDTRGLMIDESAPIKMNNVANTKFSNLTTQQLLKSKASLYQCRLCTYKSNKMTVMRHHIMSHLRYHPYVCPYCDLAKSVKSFPIKKHVATKHPGEDVIAMHCVDKGIEKKISNSYYKIKLSALSDNNDDGGRGSSSIGAGGYKNKFYREDTFNKNEFADDEENDCNDDDVDNMAGEDEDGDYANFEVKNNLDVSRVSNVNDGNKCNDDKVEINFKCKFCTFTTSIQTNMKHHLMKEFNYKPYRCNLCSFRDAQKPVINKHYQKQHLSLTSSPSKNGNELKIKEEINLEKEDLVKKMLEECRCRAPVNNSTKPTISQQNSSKSQQQSQQLATKPSNVSQPIVIQSSSKLNPIPLRPGSKIYKCPECPYTNISLKLVRGHMVKHGPHRLKCAYCDYKAHYPSRIRKHTRRQHSGQVFNYTNIVSGNSTYNRCQSDGNNGNSSFVAPLIVNDKGGDDEDDVDDDEDEDGHVKGASNSTVYLDGVPMEFPMVAHSDGWYRCQFCDYESMNRDNFKVHLVTHKPRRWKCYYCDQKYPVVFRVRRHCNVKHPKLQIKWIDVETGKVCSDSKSPQQTTAPTFLGFKKAKQCTARKSFGLRPCTALKRKATSAAVDDVTMMQSYDSELSVYNCHACHFSHQSPNFLIKHIKIEHAWTDKLPKIEIFPKNDDGEIWALRRCGFCLYESYDLKAFKQHVLDHTIWPPTQCLFCSFASFSQTSTMEHVRSEHSVEYAILEREQMCLMSKDGELDSTVNSCGDTNVDGKKDEMKINSYRGETLVRDNLPDGDADESKKIKVNRKFLCKELNDEYTMITVDENEQFKTFDWGGGFDSYVKLVNLNLKNNVKNETSQEDVVDEDDDEDDLEDDDCS